MFLEILQKNKIQKAKAAKKNQKDSRKKGTQKKIKIKTTHENGAISYDQCYDIIQIKTYI